MKWIRSPETLPRYRFSTCVVARAHWPALVGLLPKSFTVKPRTSMLLTGRYTTPDQKTRGFLFRRGAFRSIEFPAAVRSVCFDYSTGMLSSRQ